jgi:hypothetical protein
MCHSLSNNGWNVQFPLFCILTANWDRLSHSFMLSFFTFPHLTSKFMFYPVLSACVTTGINKKSCTYKLGTYFVYSLKFLNADVSSFAKLVFHLITTNIFLSWCWYHWKIFCYNILDLELCKEKHNITLPTSFDISKKNYMCMTRV